MENKRTVEIEVVLEFNDFLRVIFWQSFRKMWFIFLLALILSPLAIYSLLFFKFSPALFFPLMPAIGALLMLWGIYTGAKKSSQAVKGKIQWLFFDDGYETFTPVGTTRNNWESLEEVQEKGKDFLLFPQKPMFIIIPKRFFTTEQIAEFRELLRENLGNKAKLKK